jgi:hypothetical protein
VTDTAGANAGAGVAGGRVVSAGDRGDAGGLACAGGRVEAAVDASGGLATGAGRDDEPPQ